MSSLMEAVKSLRHRRDFRGISSFEQLLQAVVSQV